MFNSESKNNSFANTTLRLALGVTSRMIFYGFATRENIPKRVSKALRLVRLFVEGTGTVPVGAANHLVSNEFWGAIGADARPLPELPELIRATSYLVESAEIGSECVRDSMYIRRSRLRKKNQKKIEDAFAKAKDAADKSFEVIVQFRSPSILALVQDELAISKICGSNQRFSIGPAYVINSVFGAGTGESESSIDEGKVKVLVNNMITELFTESSFHELEHTNSIASVENKRGRTDNSDALLVSSKERSLLYESINGILEAVPFAVLVGVVASAFASSYLPLSLTWTVAVGVFVIATSALAVDSYRSAKRHLRNVC